VGFDAAARLPVPPRAAPNIHPREARRLEDLTMELKHRLHLISPFDFGTRVFI